MKILVCGLTGLGSGCLPFFKRPIALVFDELRRRPIGGDITFVQRVWNRHKDVSDFIRDHAHEYERIVLLGHSYGASAATRVIEAVDPIQIDLFICEDQGLDSFFITDVPVRENCRVVREFHVVYERIRFTSAFNNSPLNKHHFEDSGKLPGGHTSTFTKPAMVKRIAGLIEEVAK